MSFPSTRIVTNAGSDVTVDVQFLFDDGTPFDLTNWTVTIFEASAEFLASPAIISVSNLDAVNGWARVRIEWDSRLQINSWYFFRLQITDAPEDQGTVLFGVLYQ